MLIGYARVSTIDQNSRLQLDALDEAGCKKIFVDEGVSGAAVFKPQLVAALDFARPDEDALIVWKLDRLGRSIHDLIEVVQEFERRGIGFRSLKEGMIDTTSASGKLIFHVFSAIAEYERGTNYERTMAGIAAAKRAGTKFGRPSTITDAQWSEAVTLFAAKPPRSVVAVSRMLKVSRQSVYRRLAQDRARSDLSNDDIDGSPT